MPITDNRILLDAADSTANFVEEGGGTMNIATNTSRIQGSASIAKQVDNTREGIFFDFGSNTDVSNNIFYIWWNVTSSNLLTTLASLGVTMRFAAGANPNSNFFEVAIAGSDTYSGGFTMSVVDIEIARQLALSSPSNNNAAVGGTAPATSAIRYVGIMWDINGMLPGTDPNCFLDALWRLPAGDPGIIVSGDNAAGSPNPKPYTWADIIDAGDISDTSKAWGTVRKENGVVFLNTPVQFGNNGSPDDGDHDFEDVNVVIAWETQLVDDFFYEFSIVGDPTNTQRFIAGVKTGTGNDAVGSQGWVVTSDDVEGPRWSINSTDADIDDAKYLGCTFIHSNVIDIDNPDNEMISCQLIDGLRLWHSRP